jgi:hypothetical protein
MAETTLEEASRCPKCGTPGRLDKTDRNHPRPGSSTYTYVCENELCLARGRGWIVQVNADGSIPIRKPGQKQFPALDEYQQALARRNIEDVQQADLRGED